MSYRPSSQLEIGAGFYRIGYGFGCARRPAPPAAPPVDWKEGLLLVGSRSPGLRVAQPCAAFRRSFWRPHACPAPQIFRAGDFRRTHVEARPDAYCVQSTRAQPRASVRDQIVRNPKISSYDGHLDFATLAARLKKRVGSTAPGRGHVAANPAGSATTREGTIPRIRGPRHLSRRSLRRAILEVGPFFFCVQSLARDAARGSGPLSRQDFALTDPFSAGLARSLMRGVLGG